MRRYYSACERTDHLWATYSPNRSAGANWSWEALSKCPRWHLWHQPNLLRCSTCLLPQVYLPRHQYKITDWLPAPPGLASNVVLPMASDLLERCLSGFIVPTQITFHQWTWMVCEAFDWPLLGCLGCLRRVGRWQRLDFRGSTHRKRLMHRARKSSYLSDFVLLEINADRSFNYYVDDDYIILKYLLLIHKLKF